jgi:bifunctional DNA-binding transcriptional regulator/antitoxin component of YhaV-PrlF toxin-antitoxin module
MKLRLSKTGQIYIPRCIRKEIDLEVGNFINIVLDGEKIILTNKDYEKENKCVISENGTIHIPTEIRRLSNIKSEAFFRVILDKKEKQINLIPEIKGL